MPPSVHNLVWVTDIHLDHLPDRVGSANPTLVEFCQKIQEEDPTSLVVTGDISTGRLLLFHLQALGVNLPNLPIRFVLGNHDYFGSSFQKVRSGVLGLHGPDNRDVQWLNTAGVVKLTENTALIGHDGWYDGGYSNWFESTLLMNDWYLIEEFKFQEQKEVFRLMNELAEQGARHILDQGRRAVQEGFTNLVVATHVPPFRNNSRAPDGSLSNKHWLPNMSTKRVGDALLKLADEFPGVQITCLSGHTHTGWTETYRPNLLCLTGWSDYGKPELSIKTLKVL